LCFVRALPVSGRSGTQAPLLPAAKAAPTRDHHGHEAGGTGLAGWGACVPAGKALPTIEYLSITLYTLSVMNSNASRAPMKDGYEIPRGRMVEKLREHYKIADERVLDVMNRLPRHLFVPEALKSQAYKDNALPISAGQTISQPFIVARMTELLELAGRERVLEVGAGTGYQSAILASLGRKVFAIERLDVLAKEALQKLRMLGYQNVSVRTADGTNGWQVYAPFDAILVAAGGPDVPKPLLDQLEVGGKLVIPIGNDQRTQTLVRVVRTEKGFERQNFGPCAFVPLIGEHGWKDQNLEQ